MKKAWNKFTEEHPAAIAFFALTKPPKLPKNAQRIPYDKNGKKLPTPYGLLGEYLPRILEGDWCMQNNKGIAIIKVSSADDAKKLNACFGASKKISTSLPGISQAYQLGYDIYRHHKTIAQKMGYEL